MPALPRVDRIKTVYSAAKGLNYAWRFTDYLKQPMYNGVSRYSPQLHRITFRFCKKDEASVGVRNFIEGNIVKLGTFSLFFVSKYGLGKENPSIVIYTQPVRNQIPIIRAEYANGQVIQVNAKNMSMGDVEKDVQLLFSRSGKATMKLESRQNSLVPSIQVLFVLCIYNSLYKQNRNPGKWSVSRVNGIQRHGSHPK